MQRNLFIVKSVSLERPVSLMSSSILTASSVIGKDSSINGVVYDNDTKINSSLTITKTSVLKCDSIIHYGSSISILNANLNRFNPSQYIDVTDMGDITKYPEQFNQLVTMYNDVSLEKEKILMRLNDMKQEINKDVLSFNSVKDKYQQRIMSLQQRNTELLLKSEEEKIDNEKIVENENNLILESQFFKQEISRKDKELKSLESEMKRLDSLFAKIAASKGDSKETTKSLKEIFDSVFKNSHPDDSFDTLNETIRSILETIDCEIENSKNNVSLLNVPVPIHTHGEITDNSTLEELKFFETQDEKTIKCLENKILELNATLESTSVQFNNLKCLYDIRGEENTLLSDELISMVSKLKENKDLSEMNDTLQDAVLNMETVIEDLKSKKSKLEEDNSLLADEIVLINDKLTTITKSNSSLIKAKDDKISEIETELSNSKRDYITLQDTNNNLKSELVFVKKQVNEMKKEIECKDDRISDLEKQLDDLHYIFLHNEEEAQKLKSNFDLTSNDLIVSNNKVMEMERLLSKMSSTDIGNIEDEKEDIEKMSLVIRELTTALKKLSDDLSVQKSLVSKLTDENLGLQDTISKDAFVISNSIEKVSEMQSKFDKFAKMICDSGILSESDHSDLGSRISELISSYNSLKENLTSDDTKLDMVTEIADKLSSQNVELTSQNNMMKDLINDLSSKISMLMGDNEKKSNELKVSSSRVSELEVTLELLINELSEYKSQTNDNNDLSHEKEIASSYKKKNESITADMTILSDAYCELRKSYDDSLARIAFLDSKVKDVTILLNELTEKVNRAISFGIKAKLMSKINDLLKAESDMSVAYISHMKGKTSEKEFEQKGLAAMKLKEDSNKSIEDLLDFFDTVLRV